MGNAMKTNTQRGFTLIELIVAVAVMSLLGIGIAVATYHVINVNAITQTGMKAVKQVENAVDAISVDSQMAQVVQVSAAPDFPLVISWTEWNNTTHHVTYAIVGNQLQRSHSVNSGEPQVNIVATNIDTGEGLNTLDYSGGVLTCKLTCTVGEFRSSTESRTFRITPRPS
jgi:prepilin-type N-terminal cleavage/methylation domain-containing protein